MTIHGGPQPRRIWWVLMVLPLISAAMNVWALGYTGGWFDGRPPPETGFSDVEDLGFEIATTVWSLVPAIVLALSIAWNLLRGRRGALILGLAGLVHVILTSSSLWDIVFSESSTAALGFLFLPIFHIGVLAVFLIIAAVVNHRADRLSEHSTLGGTCG